MIISGIEIELNGGIPVVKLFPTNECIWQK